MKCTYLGHSSFLVETMGKKLLFDPFITQNPKASSIAIDSIQPDYILISHAHGDHILDVETIAKNSGAQVIANFEIVEYYTKKNIEGHSMNSGGSWRFPFGKVTMTHAYHSSSFPDGTYGGNANGFIIHNDEGSLFYSGDTALTNDFTLLGERHHFDMVILPIGDNFTMDYIDAARACSMLQAKRCMGVHFDTFNLIEIHHQLAYEHFTAKGIHLILPEIGNSYTVHS